MRRWWEQHGIREDESPDHAEAGEDMALAGR
jgi:hypothetical protein